MTPDFESTIERLTPKLQNMAAVYSQSTHQDTEDLFQAMLLTLCERQAANPDFINQTDSYILDAGRKAVLFPAIKKARTEVKFTVEEPVDPESEDSFFDTIAGPGVNPEIAVIRLEEALAAAKALRSLTGREREVLSLLVNNVRSKQISEDLGITKSAVSIHRSNVIAKLQAAIA